MTKDIFAKAEGIKERVRKFRREIHSNPELSGKEKNTASFVAGVLEDNDIEVRREVAGHGVVGLLKGGSEGPVIALRADMDALPMTDEKDCEYSSRTPGAMHACGHDAHTAILMGTAVVLASLKDGLKGSVKFIFQPSEERSITGAKVMIEEGVLEDPPVDAVVALHCYPEFEVGTIGHRPGVMTASSDSFKIVVKGKSGHASRPHQTVDAVLLASQVINAVHHIVSRRTDPLHHAVISIGTISGGKAPNIIADRVEMRGTVRAVDPGSRKLVATLLEDTIKGVTEGMGGSYELKYRYGSPSVMNDPAVDSLVAGCAAEVLAPDKVIAMEDPLMGAEDFAYFAEKVPGTLFRLGTSNHSRGITALLHNPHFDIDEEALNIGVKVMACTAARFLNQGLPGDEPGT